MSAKNLAKSQMAATCESVDAASFDVAKKFNEVSNSNNDKREAMNDLTFGQRIDNHVRKCFDYNKGSRFASDIGKTDSTGSSLFINECENLAVVDIDINKTLPKEKIDEYREEFIEMLNDDNIIIKTASGGLHIYANLTFEPRVCQNKKIDSSIAKIYDVDIFGKLCKMNQQVMLPGSTIDYRGEYGLGKGSYEFVKGSYDSIVKYTLEEVLEQLGLPVEEIVAKLKGDEKVKENKGSKSKSNEIVCDDVTEKDLEVINDSDCNVNLELFEALYKGFDGLEIHRDCGNVKASEEICIEPLYAALNSCVNDDTIDEDAFDEAIDFIRDNAELTKNLKSTFRNKCKEAKKKIKDGKLEGNIGYVINCLKFHNKEYYQNEVLPKLRKGSPLTVDANAFLESKYSLSDFKEHYGEFTSESEYINNLIKCLAFIDNGKYIVKERDDEDKIVFNVIDRNGLKEKLNFNIIVPNTAEDIELLRQRKKKITATKSISIIKALMNPKISSQFKRFVSSSVIGDDIKIFSEYRAPNPAFSYIPIENKPELIEQWLELLNDMMFDDFAKAALDHFIKTNAYLLQKCKKAPVFFVKYSATGKTGKNWFDNAFKKLYGDYAILELTEEQCNEKHNGGFVGKLYRGRDELSNDNYKSKAANAAIKRTTNNYISARRMNQDTKQEKDYAIDVLNTNESDLYGMLNSNDKALLSRLCIIRFKEQPIKESKYFSNVDVIDDVNFAYSLYCYLKSINLDSYIHERCYDRYDSSEVQAQLKALQPKSSLADFIDNVDLPWVAHKFRGDEQEYEIVKLNDLRDAYNKWMIGNRFKLSTTLDDELAKLGIIRHDKKVKIQGNMYNVYKRLITKNDDEEIEEIENYGRISL